MKNSAVAGDEELNQDSLTQSADTSTNLVAYPLLSSGEESDFLRRKRLQQETIASILRV